MLCYGTYWHPHEILLQDNKSGDTNESQSQRAECIPYKGGLNEKLRRTQDKNLPL